MYRVPVATYRLQFNARFTFDDARSIVPYLARLGVTDLYASPILKARKGSTHGYDVVDANAFNPELGTDADFDFLHASLQKHDLGFLLDIVPNHMAASPENAWWMSVLENGPQSRFVHYFDIDWRAVATRTGTENRVLLPLLGRPYGEAIESQEIRLRFDADGFFFTYYDKRLPLAPESYRTVLRECVEALPGEGVAIELRELVQGDEGVPNSKFLKETLWRIYEQDGAFHDALDRAVERLNGTPGDPESFNDLDALLDQQWYRLAYWRIASEKINYRRFFDVTDLIGVRVENPEVFEARNRRPLELIAEGKTTGLRIDHIDGLYDPVGYLRKLQLRLAQPGEENEKAFYVVVEKILAHDETLPRDFPVSGTTGYDFLDSVNAVLVDPAGLERCTRFYRDFTGVAESFDDICYDRKKQVIAELFAGEMRALGNELAELAAIDRNARDFATTEMLAALTEITACMHVYRTYTRDFASSEADRAFIERAVGEARRRAGTTVDERLFTFLEGTLLLELPSYVSEREKWLAFVQRWQQFTGRVMAKGVEDTAFYNYNRLLSLNEVGGEPGRSPDFDPVKEFHDRNARIAADWPDTLNATATHDTKRGEDLRTRISVLSELAPQWEREAKRWSAMNAPLRQRGIPDANEELFIYQTLLGMWPFDEAELATVPERLRQYLEKAAREAKTHTSWLAPNVEYEEALFAFASRLLESEAFRASLLRFWRRIAFHGFLNSLAQVVLKATSPGVPDFYQGTELWDFSLVDPDNRRPVDYERRTAALKKLEAADARGTLDVTTLLRRWTDGRVKLFTTWRALAARKRNAAVFRRGDYRPLPVSPNVVAFSRGDSVIVAVPRLTSQLGKGVPLGDVWGDAALPLGGWWRNAFTGEQLEGNALPLAQMFATFPVAILERA
jgi:(1->4)-alpha-D-glucan 1-alpha-D-glucosylmutase